MKKIIIVLSAGNTNLSYLSAIKKVFIGKVTIFVSQKSASAMEVAEEIKVLTDGELVDTPLLGIRMLELTGENIAGFAIFDDLKEDTTSVVIVNNMSVALVKEKLEEKFSITVPQIRAMRLSIYTITESNGEKKIDFEEIS